MSGQPSRTSPLYSHRLASLRERLGEASIDALLVTHPPNLRYLTGFDGSTGALIMSADRCVLVVDGRYLTSANARVKGDGELRDVVVRLADRSVEEAIVSTVMSGTAIWTLGVEAAAMTLSQFDKLSEVFGTAESRGAGNAPRLRATEGVVERLRLVKDASEVATLREAAALLSKAAVEALTFVRVGRTEREVAAEIDAALRRVGFERPAFETIVASGPNSSLPHARPGKRTIEAGDGVVLDFGGVYDGYCVDLTRTVQLAPGTQDYARLFEAVRAAHTAAIASVRPGVKASEVDGAARRVLAQEGLAEAFVHGTGHGLGLEVHEAPRISKVTSHPDAVLEPGMVFTIEPGVYLAGVGGVRIEDDVLVVESGCEVLTNVPIDRESRRSL